MLHSIISHTHYVSVCVGVLSFKARWMTGVRQLPTDPDLTPRLLLETRTTAKTPPVSHLHLQCEAGYHKERVLNIFTL